MNSRKVIRLTNPPATDSGREEGRPPFLPPSPETPQYEDKGSVQNLKSGSGTGYNLPKIDSVDWEYNSKGGWEAWHVPPGAIRRAEKTYLVYIGKRKLEELEGDPRRDQQIRQIVKEKAAGKGIEL